MKLMGIKTKTINCLPTNVTIVSSHLMIVQIQYQAYQKEVSATGVSSSHGGTAIGGRGGAPQKPELSLQVRAHKRCGSFRYT